MKVEQITFTSSLPEVNSIINGLKIDFGTLVLELNFIEVESLIFYLTHALSRLGKADLIQIGN